MRRAEILVLSPHLWSRVFVRAMIGKKCPRVSHEMAQFVLKFQICIGYLDGSNPITGKGIHLRSPTPIMAPDSSK